MYIYTYISIYLSTYIKQYINISKYHYIYIFCPSSLHADDVHLLVFRFWQLGVTIAPGNPSAADDQKLANETPISRKPRYVTIMAP